MLKAKNSFAFRLMANVINVCFFFTFMIPARSYAQSPADLGMPRPGTMVGLTSAYIPIIAKGLRVHPENPILFDFIIDTGNSGLDVQAERAQPLRVESEKLIKYFLAALTIPEDDLWVNLSPYEKDRIIPDQLGQTEMGRDMLAQDYMLKQLTASLIYPEKELGREFWSKVYAKAQQLYGSSDIPVNTFNKVWIVADKAKVYVNNNTAFVVGSHLKVMLEEDYLAVSKNIVGAGSKPARTNVNQLGSQIVREIVLPALETEVNSGKTFANLRQIFHSMILAAWYKKNLKEALLNQVYSDKGKINGVNVADATIKEQIYQEYLKAYKKGVFNYIKDDIQVNGQRTPRKYFSGGEVLKIHDLAQTSDPNDRDAAMFISNLAKGRFVTASTVINNASSPDIANVVPDAALSASDVRKKELLDIIHATTDLHRDDEGVARALKELHGLLMMDEDADDVTINANIVGNSYYGPIAQRDALRNLDLLVAQEGMWEIVAEAIVRGLKSDIPEVHLEAIATASMHQSEALRFDTKGSIELRKLMGWKKPETASPDEEAISLEPSAVNYVNLSDRISRTAFMGRWNTRFPPTLSMDISGKKLYLQLMSFYINRSDGSFIESIPIEGDGQQIIDAFLAQYSRDFTEDAFRDAAEWMTGANYQSRISAIIDDIADFVRQSFLPTNSAMTSTTLSYIDGAQNNVTLNYYAGKKVKDLHLGVFTAVGTGTEFEQAEGVTVENVRSVIGVTTSVRVYPGNIVRSRKGNLGNIGGVEDKAILATPLIEENRLSVLATPIIVYLNAPVGEEGVRREILNPDYVMAYDTFINRVSKHSTILSLNALIQLVDLRQLTSNAKILADMRGYIPQKFVSKTPIPVELKKALRNVVAALLPILKEKDPRRPRVAHLEEIESLEALVSYFMLESVDDRDDSVIKLVQMEDMRFHVKNLLKAEPVEVAVQVRGKGETREFVVTTSLRTQPQPTSFNLNLENTYGSAIRALFLRGTQVTFEPVKQSSQSFIVTDAAMKVESEVEGLMEDFVRSFGIRREHKIKATKNEQGIRVVVTQIALKTDSALIDAIKGGTNRLSQFLFKSQNANLSESRVQVVPRTNPFAAEFQIIYPVEGQLSKPGKPASSKPATSKRNQSVDLIIRDLKGSPSMYLRLADYLRLLREHGELQDFYTKTSALIISLDKSGGASSGNVTLDHRLLMQVIALPRETFNERLHGKERREEWKEPIKFLKRVLFPAAGDRASVSSTGGIDLNSKNLQMDVNGQKIDIKFDPAMIEQFKRGDFTGVRPVILNITPTLNILPLLGLRQEEESKVALS